MQNAKNHVLSIIKQLPDDASYDDILYEIEFQQQIIEGRDQIARGVCINHEQAMDRLKKWLE